MKTKGRTTIYANYTEKQFLSGTIEEQGNKVIDVLSNSQDIHLKNKKETLYLIDYMYGVQDIQEKEKLTRTDINHKSVENWAYAFVDWKKNFLLGKPIQYSPQDNTATKEISLLNKYLNYENKDKLDLDIYEDVLVCGRGYRYNNYSKMTEEDETPVELLNLSCWDTEVVYSSGINTDMGQFMDNLTLYNNEGTNPNDDAPDSLAMLAASIIEENAKPQKAEPLPNIRKFF